MNALDHQATEILQGNDLGGYTVPTAGLYPFQWNWDSCLVALGWAQIDLDRAFTEIETLFAAQWPDGMVPHIVFHRPDPGYFPGPERWGSNRTPATSGITQPPVAASCVRRLVDAGGAKASPRGQALFPKLLASHRWFHSVRDPDQTGLVTTLHPWETGMDNSPAWDEALARVAIAPDLEPYVRKDTSHVDPAMRPTKVEYDRFMTLVHLYRKAGWDHEISRTSPLRVADVGTNCILLRADRDLLALAERFGEDAAAAEIRTWIDRAVEASACFLEPTTGLWHSYDQISHTRVPTPTSAGFLAFRAGIGDVGLTSLAEAWHQGARSGVPSVRTGDPRFDSKRYWRGPNLADRQFHDCRRPARERCRHARRANSDGQPQADRTSRVLPGSTNISTRSTTRGWAARTLPGRLPCGSPGRVLSGEHRRDPVSASGRSFGGSPPRKSPSRKLRGSMLGQPIRVISGDHQLSNRNGVVR